MEPILRSPKSCEKAKKLKKGESMFVLSHCRSLVPERHSLFVLS